MFIMFIMFIMFTPPKHGISTYFMGFDPSPFLHWGPAGPFFGPAGVALQVMVRMASIQRCWTHFRPVLPA
jgi:hypothetical protein